MTGPHDYLVPHYVEYVRRRSSLATRDEHYSALELAAHLYAVALQLAEDGHDLKNLPLYERSVTSLEELGSILAGLPNVTSARQLYVLLKDALSLIEAELCKSKDEGYNLTVDVDELRTGDARRLGGHVICWVRKPRLFRTLRLQGFDNAHEAGRSLPPRPLEHLGNHLDRLFCHWKRGNSLPTVKRARPEDVMAPLLSEGGRDLESGAPFRIALCPLVGEAHPLFVLTEERGAFRACDQTPMFEPEGHAIRKQMEVIFDLADQNGIHLVVLPELTVDPATRAWLIETLSRSHSNLPFGVVAGSFHFDKSGISRPHNESLFLDSAGRKLLEHQKRGRFRITKAQLAACLDLGYFRDAERLRAELPTLPGEIDELIEPGSTIELLDTALGQMAVLICADAIDKIDRPELQTVVAQLRPDFVLLPSMSFETDRFDEFATGMEDLGVATFFVNAHCVCPEDQILAAVCLDLYRGPGDPATRVRWRRGGWLEEWIRHELPGDAGHWQPLGPLGMPFDWLRDPCGVHLGLVFDLGAYWRGR